MYKQVVLVSLLAVTALGWQQNRIMPLVPLEGGEMILE